MTTFRCDGPVSSPIRPALASDVARIDALVVDLATYERAAEEVRSTPASLHEALFGPQPAAYALVAEVDGAVVGFALYFRSFSTWEGVHGIYLEDLFVAPEQRGSGLGKALLAALAAIAVERGYARLEWAVLNWNQPAHRLLQQPRGRPYGRVDRLPAGRSGSAAGRLRTTPTGGPACRTDWALISAPPSPRPRSPTARPSPR